MIGVRYTGTFQDHSGYGNANREFITSLFITGVNVTTELVIQVPEKSNYGLSEHVCLYLRDRKIPYRFKIIHLTPDMYPRYIEENKYNIGHLFWETNKLPKEWVTPCNTMNEIWTASERMKRMIQESGVTTPIYCFPQPINPTLGDEEMLPFETQYKKDFTFYSVFQWIERKNARTLLRAYWQAFEGKDDVTLLLKTYRVNYSPDEYTTIKRNIEEWKRELALTHYPKIFLVKKLMTDREMIKFHASGDCFINPSSGEGWCRPIQEAMLMSKPVISADNGGITDYLNDEYYYRVPSLPKQATEVTWIPWYTKEQKWWEISEGELIKTLREAYNARNWGSKISKAKRFVVEETSYQKVGYLMRQRLESIDRII